MPFDISNTMVQTFLLRMLHALFILGIAIEFYRSSRGVDNTRLIKSFWHAAMFAGSFFIARIIAGVLDSAFVNTIGWCSNLVNVIYSGYILWKARSIRVILTSPKTSKERIEIRASFDAILDRLDAAKQKLHTLH
jgi:hypothetical protein